LLIHPANKKLIILVFILFYLINITSSGGHFDLWDGIEAFLVTESMALKHTAKLDPTIPSVSKLHFNVNYTVAFYNSQHLGQYSNQNVPLKPVYTVRSLLLSAIAIPFYYAALLFSTQPIVVISLFLNPLIIALISAIIFCFSIELYGSPKIGFALSLIFNVSSFVLPYVTTFWPQPLQALLLISAAYFMYKSLHFSPAFICNYNRGLLLSYGGSDNNDHNRHNSRGIYFAGLGGLFLGLSLFAHPTSLVLIPAFFIYYILSMRKNNPKSFLVFITIATITLFFVGLVNFLRFGSFTEFGYGYFGSLATHDGWKGLIGVLISPGAGLFVYFPIAILLPWAAKNMKKHDKRLFYLFAYILIINWLDVGTLSFHFEPFSWWGTGWGPRYHVTILPFITMIIGSLFLKIEKRVFLKYSIIALSVMGFCITMLGTLVWWSYDQVYLELKEKLPRNNLWNILIWHPFYSPIVIHAKSLLENYISQIDVQRYLYTSWRWGNYGLAPCAYDNYIYCKFGITYNITIAVLIAFVALSILIETRIFKSSLFTRYWKNNTV
jgi:hypothetical protein